MLTQYRFLLSPDRDCIPQTEWGYRMYSALLEQLPQDFGEEVHTDRITPVSQFFDAKQPDKPIWIVNLLGRQSEEALCGTMDKLKQLWLRKDNVMLTVQDKSVIRIADADELIARVNRHPGTHALHFCTPTAFKSRGQYLNLPSSRLIVQSLMQKWNGCILECPIEDEDGEGVESVAAGLRCISFRLQNKMFYLKGNSVPGFVGSMTMENRLSGFQRQLLDALLIFAGFSGVGIKTTLGMGGVKNGYR